MAFCTFLVKCVGKVSLLFTAKLCFPDPSDSPLLKNKIKHEKYL